MQLAQSVGLFLTLPRELRDIIYDHFFSYKYLIFQNDLLDSDGMKFTLPAAELSILSTCRVLNREISQQIFSKATFRWPLRFPQQRKFTLLPREVNRRIRNLYIEIDCSQLDEEEVRSVVHKSKQFVRFARELESRFSISGSVPKTCHIKIWCLDDGSFLARAIGRLVPRLDSFSRFKFELECMFFCNSTTDIDLNDDLDTDEDDPPDTNTWPWQPDPYSRVQRQMRRRHEKHWISDEGTGCEMTKYELKHALESTLGPVIEGRCVSHTPLSYAWVMEFAFDGWNPSFARARKEEKKRRSMAHRQQGLAITTEAS